MEIIWIIIKIANNNPIIFSYNGYNKFEIIDSKEKYIEYCKNINTELDQNIEPENGNWIKFCLKEYDELVENHYSIEELKELNFNNIDEYISKSELDSKLISFEYINNGFYNYNKNHFNILSIMTSTDGYCE